MSLLYHLCDLTKEIYLMTVSFYNTFLKQKSDSACHLWFNLRFINESNKLDIGLYKTSVVIKVELARTTS